MRLHSIRGAVRRCRWPFRCRGPYRRSAAARLSDVTDQSRRRSAEVAKGSRRWFSETLPWTVSRAAFSRPAFRPTAFLGVSAYSRCLGTARGPTRVILGWMQPLWADGVFR